MKLDRFRMEPESPFFSLTAMIDVLFLMIIVLVLGANFDSVVSVELPEARGGKVGDGLIRLELPADGGALLGGRRMDEQQTVSALRRRLPRSVLLLPDRRLSVDALFRWYDLLGHELGVPVSVGVSAPTSR